MVAIGTNTGVRAADPDLGDAGRDAPDIICLPRRYPNVSLEAPLARIPLNDVGNDRGSRPVLTSGELVHVAQVHSMWETAGPQAIQYVVECQMKIAAVIRMHPDDPIVLEGETVDRTPEQYHEMASSDEPNLVNAMRATFPNGLPDSPAALTDHQARLVYEFGAPLIMWRTGEIKAITRSDEPDRSDQTMTELIEVGESRYGKDWHQWVYADPTLRRLALDEREETVVSIGRDLLRNGAARALIVFGTGHDLSGHATSEDQVTFSRIDLASDHVVLDGIRYPQMPIFKPFEAYDSNWSAALCEYGIVRREAAVTIDIIADEQRKILRHLSGNGARLSAWQWQHFATTELRIEALGYLDPSSIGTGSYTNGDFVRTLVGDARLKEEVVRWLNDLSSRG